MTIILMCDICTKETINLREVKLFDYNKLTEKTGWEMKEGQMHICKTCVEWRKKFDIKIGEHEEDFESDRIMSKAQNMSIIELGAPTPPIDISDGEGKMLPKKKVYDCRYCIKTYPFGQAGVTSIKYHETRKHPDEYQPLKPYTRRKTRWV